MRKIFNSIFGIRFSVTQLVISCAASSLSEVELRRKEGNFVLYYKNYIKN